jgi:ADP-ribose pyrophosphatase YjhB (NUDIX family)
MRIKLTATKQFVYRVAGIVVHKGKVLFHRAEQDDFLSLPGGSCEFWEDASKALKREMREELKADVEVLSLPWVVENFFEWNGCKCHEIGLYFVFKFKGKSKKNYDTKTMIGEETFSGPKKIKLIFEWIDINSLSKREIYPKFLRTGLKKIPLQTRFINQREI